MPERVQRFRGLAALRFALLARRDRLRHQQPRQRGFVGIGLGGSGRDGKRGGLQGPVIRTFGDVREDELVAMPRDGADEGRLPRLVAERAPQAPHGLRERAVRDHDVAPHHVQDVAPRHRLVPPLHEQDQEVEVARDQRHLEAVADEHAPAGERVNPPNRKRERPGEGGGPVRPFQRGPRKQSSASSSARWAPTKATRPAPDGLLERGQDGGIDRTLTHAVFGTQVPRHRVRGVGSKVRCEDLGDACGDVHPGLAKPPRGG